MKEQGTFILCLFLFRCDEIAALRKELAALRGDLANRDTEFARSRDVNTDHKGHAGAASKDLAYERSVNDGIRDELNHVNADIDHNISLLKDREGKIAYLRRENDVSRANQGGLKGSIAGRAADCNVALDKIADRNAHIDGLNRDIDRNLAIIHDLKLKISSENDYTSQVNYDNTNFAVRNVDLDRLVGSLRLKIEDRERDIAALQRNIADIQDAYHSKVYDNDYKERNIYGVSSYIDNLSLDKRRINSDVALVADREAWLKGNYGRATYLRDKQVDYDYDARQSSAHVDYVRANSPARSPVRRYY